MSRKKRRQLRPEEQELWSKVIRDAAPLREPSTRAPDADPLPQPPKVEAPRIAPPQAQAPPLPDFTRDFPQAPQKTRVSYDLKPSVSERLARQRVDMDRKRYGRMKRGKLAPEGRIDLHGMTQAQAHSALNGFIQMSHGMGRRLVLVITGKGPGPGMHGVLRSQVPHWLQQAPLRGLILQVAEAHQSHGGAGALYVYLRRGRDG